MKTSFEQSFQQEKRIRTYSQGNYIYYHGAGNGGSLDAVTVLHRRPNWGHLIGRWGFLKRATTLWRRRTISTITISKVLHSDMLSKRFTFMLTRNSSSGATISDVQKTATKGLLAPLLRVSLDTRDYLSLSESAHHRHTVKLP